MHFFVDLRRAKEIDGTRYFPVYVMADTSQPGQTELVAWCPTQAGASDIVLLLNNSPAKLAGEKRERLANQGSGVPYDLKPLYHEEIAGLLDEVSRVCDQHSLPYIFVLQTLHNGTIPGFTIRGQLPPERSNPWIIGIHEVVTNCDLQKIIGDQRLAELAKDT